MKIRDTSTALGAIRFGVCLVFLVQALDASFADVGRLPATLLTPIGIMARLPWSFYDSLITPAGMSCLKVALCAALFLAAIGYQSRITLIAALVLEVLYQGILRSFSHFNHDEMAGLMILGILACSPAGDGFSVDGLGRAGKGKGPTLRHGYPILLSQAVVAWVYCTSGLLKLWTSGFGYFTRENLPVLSIRHSLDNLQDTGFRVGFLLPAIADVLPLVLMVTVAWEITFPIGVFVRRTRAWYLLFGLVFHLSTLFVLNLMFWNLLAMYLIFVDWPAVGRWLVRPGAPFSALAKLRDWTTVPEEFPNTRMLPARADGRGELLWDGTCGFCARMVDVLQRFATRPISARPFQVVDRLPTEIAAWTQHQMHWVTSTGEVLGGSRALVAALRDGGRTFIGGLLGLGALRPFTWLAYRLVAGNRDSLGPLAGAACEAPAPEQSTGNR